MYVSPATERRHRTGKGKIEVKANAAYRLQPYGQLPRNGRLRDAGEKITAQTSVFPSATVPPPSMIDHGTLQQDYEFSDKLHLEECTENDGNAENEWQGVNESDIRMEDT